jgi:hypothetical protein
MSFLVVLACFAIDAWENFTRFLRHPFQRRTG